MIVFNITKLILLDFSLKIILLRLIFSFDILVNYLSL